jgi:hypothetical protein
MAVCWHTFILTRCASNGILDIMGRDASRLRQQILQALEEIRRSIDPILEERGPLFRGSFGTRRRVCGNPNCRCVRGQLHESKYLTATDGGRARQVHIPAGEEVKVASGVERYRLFHRRRAELAELLKGLLDLVDVLGRSLLGPYPPHNPLPPAKRRGRVPRPRGRKGR